MDRFIYSVWFLDTLAHDEDQDREWVACIGIEARTAEEAQQWGDVLAHERGLRFPSETFVRSSIELESETTAADISTLPSISVGQIATDALNGR